MLTSTLSSANQGIQFHLRQFAIAADRISDPDSIAGVKEIMELKQAEQGIKVNVAVSRTANKMAGSLLDMLV